MYVYEWKREAANFLGKQIKTSAMYYSKPGRQGRAKMRFEQRHPV